MGVGMEEETEGGEGAEGTGGVVVERGGCGGGANTVDEFGETGLGHGGRGRGRGKSGKAPCEVE